MYTELDVMIRAAKKRPGWIEIKPETFAQMKKIQDFQQEMLERKQPILMRYPSPAEREREHRALVINNKKKRPARL
jgi:hypothetical protein